VLTAVDSVCSEGVSAESKVMVLMTLIIRLGAQDLWVVNPNQ
jgi:hypothetical protein